MRALCTSLLAVFLIVGTPALSSAADKGSPDEAQDMVTRAVTYIESNGSDAAYATFNAGEAGFRDRDLYVFVFDFEGKVLSHGSNAKLVGKNLLAIKDSDGKAFVKEFVDVAQGSGEGWVDYKWPNPTTKKVEQKSSFIKRQGDALVGVGIYK